MIRPPWILWRSLAAELWRLLLLTTLVVVVIASFASAVQPLARGLLSPETAIRFMALSAVPMLQFALPFAAGFAATLAHHRFAADNEALAASAGGVSHRAILAPAVGSGLALAAGLGMLTTLVIPRFFQRMEQTIRRDVAAIVVSRLAEGESVEIEGRLVRAGRVHRLGPDDSIDAFERLVLEDVLMIDFSKAGAVQNEIAAARAEAWLRRQPVDNEDATVLSIRLVRPVVIAPGQVFANSENIDLRPIAFKHFTRHTPRFLTNPELARLRENPELNPEVERRRRTLAAQVGAARLAAALAARLAGEGRIRLLDGDGRPVTIRAGALAPDEGKWFLTAGGAARPGRVEVEIPSPTGGSRRLGAARAWLSWTVADPGGPDGLALRLEMEGVIALDGEAGGRAERSLQGLRAPDDPSPSALSLGGAELIRAAEESAGAAPTVIGEAVRSAAADFENRARRLRRDAMGQQHERWSYALACLVMTVTGAVMALRLREGMPLAVYLWSFFPALGAILTIAGGGNMVRTHPVVGLAVMWSGVALLAAYTLVSYLDLRRH